MKTLCASCEHDKYPSGCEYACSGVVGWDEKEEIVTTCEDYSEGISTWEQTLQKWGVRR